MNSTITASLAKVNSIWLKVTCEIEVSTSTTVTISSTDTVYVNTKRPMTTDGIDLKLLKKFLKSDYNQATITFELYTLNEDSRFLSMIKGKRFIDKYKGMNMRKTVYANFKEDRYFPFIDRFEITSQTLMNELASFVETANNWMIVNL